MKYKKTREKKVVIQVPDLVQKLSTWDLIKDAYRIFVGRKINPKRSPVNPNGMVPDPRSWPKVHHLALVVEGELMDVMVVQPKFASVLLSQPTFIEVSPETHGSLVLGSKYVDGKFVAPENTHVHGEHNED
jgi:hypothetical protein